MKVLKNIFKTNRYELLDNINPNIDFKIPVNNNQHMANITGFINNALYRIINVADNLVIALDEDNKLVTKSIDSDKNDFQTFQVRQTESGCFEIRSLFQKDPSALMVWDYSPTRKKLLQKQQTSLAARSNQNWVSEHVPGKGSTYFIISAPEKSKCLKGMGENEQIRIAAIPVDDDDIIDKSYQWKLQTVEPVSTGNTEGSSVIQNCLPENNSPVKRSATFKDTERSPSKRKCSML